MWRWFSMRQLVLAGIIGLVVGYSAFLLTAQATQSIMPPECRTTVDAGFDPVSGLPHGQTIECGQLTGLGGRIPVAQVYLMSDTLAGRRAIPVPVGFVIGGALTLIGLTVRRARVGPAFGT